MFSIPKISILSMFIVLIIIEGTLSLCSPTQKRENRRAIRTCDHHIQYSRYLLKPLFLLGFRASLSSAPHSLTTDWILSFIDLPLHFFDDLPDAFVVRIDNDIPRAGWKVQPVIIRFAFVAALVVPLFQRFL